ncbi:hypothetical protein [Pseudomonas protegens]|nr:hypothetical protein [Pseudomonas protegens]
MSRDIVLSNGVVTFAIRQTTDTTKLVSKLLRFLHPYFSVVQEEKPFFSMQFLSYEELPSEVVVCCREPLTVRRSTKSAFDLSGLYGEIADETVALLDVSTRTAFVVDRKERLVKAYVSDSSFVHLIEFIRYGALLVEESNGTVLLHASAVTNEQGTFLILGEKHAGKTTTMLSAVLGSAYKLFSGDKVLVRLRDGQLWVRGWPDYPHIGMGTLNQYQGLAQQLGVNPLTTSGTARANHDKELVDPDIYREVIPHASTGTVDTLQGIVFPNISSERKLFRQLAESEVNVEYLPQFVEYPFEFTPGHWHGLFSNPAQVSPTLDIEILKPLCELPWLVCEGGAPLHIETVS